MELKDYIRQSYKRPNRKVLEGLGASEELIEYLCETPGNMNWNVIDSVKGEDFVIMTFSINTIYYDDSGYSSGELDLNESDLTSSFIEYLHNPNLYNVYIDNELLELDGSIVYDSESDYFEFFYTKGLIHVSIHFSEEMAERLIHVFSDSELPSVVELKIEKISNMTNEFVTITVTDGTNSRISKAIKNLSTQLNVPMLIAEGISYWVHDEVVTGNCKQDSKDGFIFYSDCTLKGRWVAQPVEY